MQCWFSLQIVTPVVSKGLPSRKEEKKQGKKKEEKNPHNPKKKNQTKTK